MADNLRVMSRQRVTNDNIVLPTDPDSRMSLVSIVHEAWGWFRSRRTTMLVRTNLCYRPHFAVDCRGFLLVTRHYIVATGRFAKCWR
jgi:hypothetical protein